MDFDTARLRAFLHVVERGTVVAAASSLGYTAPAVSQQITKLEAQLGAALFDRVGGRLQLSARGHQLLPVARQLLDLVSLAERQGELAAPAQRLVIVGFASAIRSLVLPLLDGAAREQEIVEVREAEDDVALRELRLGQADLALVQEYEGLEYDRADGLTYTPLLSDRLRLLAPPGVSTAVRLGELARSGWLVNGAGTRCEAGTERVLAAAGITPRIVGRISDTTTLLALVSAGHGATIAPELVIAGHRSELTVARAELGVRRHILAVTRTVLAAEYAPTLRRLATIARRALRP